MESIYRAVLYLLRWDSVS